MQADNLKGATVGGAAEHERILYLTWADGAERQLRQLFAADLTEGLLSDRYWHIHQISPTTEGWAYLVRAEVDAQLARLTEIITKLQQLQELASKPGRIVVPDTNVLLHYKLIDQMPWAQVVGYSNVRLVIPLLVLEELDNKKYLGTDKIARRARTALKSFDSHLEEIQQGGAARVRDNVTVEVFGDDEDHHRRSNPDEEVLDRCVLLQQAVGEPVTLVTADYGMRLRASARGMQVTPMPDTHLRNSADAATQRQ